MKSKGTEYSQLRKWEERGGNRVIYELGFSYYDDNPENDDNVIIAVYSSYKQAEAGLKKFAQQPRFKGKEKFLYICERKINDAFWTEGFWPAVPSYFKIELLKDYKIDKYEENYIEILDEKGEKIYEGNFHDYSDYKQCICLRNITTGWMYCLDKKQKNIQYKTKDFKNLLYFLLGKYEIEKLGWRSIF